MFGSGDNVRDVILVVDDDDELRRGVVRYLRGAMPEYRVVEARNGHEALNRLDAHTALVISDVNMPLVDGYTFCEGVRTDPSYRDFAELPIILLTARDGEHDLERSYSVGSTLHLPKPLDTRVLSQALHSLL